MYFSSAIQIGMTATPKAVDGANNLDYFGRPLYVYSLKQGIEDGFLAPYKVTNSFINIDLQGYTPEEGEKDLFGEEIEHRSFNSKDYDKTLIIKERRKIIAHRITTMLEKIGRYTKTIVFCTSIDEAHDMRDLLAMDNADCCKKDPRYVMSITSEDQIGKKQLDNFIDPASKYPVIATTSELLSTGVDCKTCGLIVIDKEINSMTEFKQIIGRGTRLRPDYEKWHFDILDFRNATKKFQDPEFDGIPDPITDPGSSGSQSGKVGVDGQSGEKSRIKKYTINGKDVSIQTEIVSYLGVDGKLIKESLMSYTKKSIRGLYATLDDFIQHWSATDKKKAIVEELKEYDVLIDAIRKKDKDLADADIFDIVCHVAFDKDPLTRRERAYNVKKRDYLSKYEGAARKVLDTLLEKYSKRGILEIEDDDVLKLKPFNEIGTPS
jgi:type I restriction enzyme R subunit